MIKEETVFILGAGASKPYGYPTGKELRETICKEFNSHQFSRINWTQSSRQERFFWDNEASNLSRYFGDSSTESIDLFLARNPGLSDIGKLAIILSILEYESKSKFRESRKEDGQDWYTYIFNKMTSSLTDPTSYKNFSKNKVTFVTFNYDRSLEHFLYESLRNSFLSADENKIKEQLRQIPICHVYGKISDLPWENDGGTPYLKVENDDTWDTWPFEYINKCSSNIHTIHDRETYDRSELLESISKAKRIFFLGFGYADENLGILQTKNTLKRNQQIFGTAMGYIEKEIKDVRRSLCSELVHWTESHHNPHIHDMDCVKLLREYL